MALAIFFCATVGSLSLVSFLSPSTPAEAATSNANVQAAPSQTATSLDAAISVVRIRIVSSPWVGVPAWAGASCPRLSGTPTPTPAVVLVPVFSEVEKRVGPVVAGSSPVALAWDQQCQAPSRALGQQLSDNPSAGHRGIGE